MTMNERNPVSLAVAIGLAAVVAMPIHARVSEPNSNLVDAKLVEPHYVLGMFLEAVDRGELVIFGKTLDRSMIVPVRVEYAYDIDSVIPRIKVYSDLKKPIAVPKRRDCAVHAVSAVIGADGHITDTAAHIWMK